jgi:hypothetical protein
MAGSHKLLSSGETLLKVPFNKVTPHRSSVISLSIFTTRLEMNSPVEMLTKGGDSLHFGTKLQDISTFH